MTSSRIVFSGLAFLALGLAACGGFGEVVSVGSDAITGDGGPDTDGGGVTADGGKPCQVSNDCGTGLWACAFSPSAVCGDYGKCIFYGDQPVCASISPGCTCGHEVNMGCNGIPEGYTVGPGATFGKCSAEADASTCTTNADCGSDGMCGFVTTDSCTAVGQCYPNSGGALCNSFLAECACDGTTINGACEGYPGGVASKPVIHSGSCDGG